MVIPAPPELENPNPIVSNALHSMVFWFVIVGFVLMCGTVGFSCAGYNTQVDGRRQTLINRRAGFQNRAVNCRILVNQGDVLPPPCLDKNVTPYYDQSNPVPRKPPVVSSDAGG